MSLPLGHLAVGVAVHEISSDNSISPFRHLKLALFLLVLSNLPDLDILVGLLLEGNGSAFHRGPSHSILFAILMGGIAANGWKFSSLIPKVRFNVCFLVIFSHVMADFLFSGSPVSFLWPLEVNFSSGHKGLGDVVNMVFMQAYRDIGVIMGSTVVVAFQRLVKADFGNVLPKYQVARNELFASIWKGETA